MSVRGVISGVAGSGAVALVAALSLGMTHAAADPTRAPRTARAQITPAARAGAASGLRLLAAPAAVTTEPLWLRRLLSLRDPPMEAPHHRG